VIGGVVGGLQSSGTAQASVVLINEVAIALITSLWLPWADNSAMGPLTFGLSISRIVIGVLLVVLSPSVIISQGATFWLSYIVLLVQAILLVLLALIVLFKLAELSVRIFGGVEFDENHSARSGGLLGAIRRLDRQSRKTGQHGGATGVGTSRAVATSQRSRRSSTYSVGHLGLGEDDGYIMAAFGNGSNDVNRSNVYGSSMGYQRRPSWSDTRSRSGFTRSYKAGYQLGPGEQLISSASPTAMHSSGGNGLMSSNPNRKSQSALIESGSPLTSGIPPATSGLLSNTVPRTFDPIPSNKNSTSNAGFLNRFRRNHGGSETSSDEDDDEEKAERGIGGRLKRLWPIQSRLTHQQDNSMEVDQEGGESAPREFVVVRKAQPPSRVGAASRSTLTSQITSKAVLVSAPHLSIEPPSPRTSMVGRSSTVAIGEVGETGGGLEWTEEEEKKEQELRAAAREKKEGLDSQ
jgi:hypothetical protein